MVGRSLPLLVDIATGRNFGRFIEAKSSRLKENHSDIFYHPMGFAGVRKVEIIRDVPNNGWVEITQSDDRNVIPEGIVFVLQGENGESSVKDIIMKEISNQNIQLLERIDHLQTELAKYQDSIKSANVGFDRQLQDLKKSTEIIDKSQQQQTERKSPYGRMPRISGDEDDG